MHPLDTDLEPSVSDADLERVLAVLAKVFVTSEEVNDRADEARRALGDRVFADLASLVEALRVGGTPFEFRPFGIEGVANHEIARNLLVMFRTMLFRAARICALYPELREADAWRLPLVTKEEGGASSEERAPKMAEPDEYAKKLAELEAEALQLTTDTVLDAPLFADPIAADPLLALGDLNFMAQEIFKLLEEAEERFGTLLGSSGIAAPSAASRFARGLTAARDCVVEVQFRRPSAAAIASDVFDGICDGFERADPSLPERLGFIPAAEILGVVVLELAGLRPHPKEPDDNTRREYMSKMRKRARGVYED